MAKVAEIEYLRFPLTLFVVMEHTFPQFTPDRTDITCKAFDIFLRGNSVPVFFFISGWLFFNGYRSFSRDFFMGKLRRRVRTLLVPYILWNIFAIVLIWLTLQCGMSGYASYSGPFSPTPRNLLNCFWTYDMALVGGFAPSAYPVNVALWYVRDLMVLCCLSPVICLCVRKSRAAILAVCALIWATTLNPSAFFFTSGACLSVRGHGILSAKRPLVMLSLMAYVVSCAALFALPYGSSAAYVVKQVSIIAFVPLAFTLFSRIKLRHFNMRLASASVLIYFAHQPVCGKVHKLLSSLIMPSGCLSELVVGIMAVMVTVAAICAFYLIAQRYIPKTLNVLTGRNPQLVTTLTSEKNETA